MPVSAFDETLIAFATEYFARIVVGLPKFLFGLLVAAAFWWLAARVRARFKSYARLRSWPAEIELLATQAGYVTTLVLGVIVVLEFWGQNVTALVAGLGVAGVAVGFALRNILENFVAGVLLLVQRPFGIGDQIKSGDFQGEVEAINLRATLIRTIDHRQIIIPNATLYTSSIVNLTRYPYRRSSVVLAVQPDRNLDGICHTILETVRRVEGVLSDPAPEILITGLDQTALTLEARYWTGVRAATVNRVAAQVTQELARRVVEGGAESPAPVRIVKVSTPA